MHARNTKALELLTAASVQLDVSALKKRERTWRRLLSSYYMDVCSGKEEIAYTTLVAKTAIKFCLDALTVIDILDKCDAKPHSDGVVYEEELSDQILSDIVPTPLTRRLIALAGNEQFHKLVSRYYPVLLTDGLFLGIDPRVLIALESSSKNPTIECYASPFNHTLLNYCSLFREDHVYGSLPRFDEYIKYVDYPCRLFLNPPYTPAAIQICIDSLLIYVRKHRGEFICLLPLMYNYEPLDRLLAHPNTHRRVLDPGTYTLYSFTTDKIITATMALQVCLLYTSPSPRD